MQYSLFYLFAYGSASNNITQHSTPPPPMSLYDVVSLQQCCISATVSHYEINTDLYHYVESIQSIPHCEIYIVYSVLWNPSMGDDDAPLLDNYTVLYRHTASTKLVNTNNTDQYNLADFLWRIYSIQSIQTIGLDYRCR